MKPAKKASKSSSPSKLTKRTRAPKEPAISEEPALTEPEENAAATLPDPEVEDRKVNPGRYKAMPSGKISITCACGVLSTVYVDDPGIYDAKGRQILFLDRGASYNPPLCPFCFRRQSKAKRERLAG